MMTPEEAIRKLQSLAHDHKAAHGYLAPYPQQWRNVEAHADTLGEIAALIESLTADRDALAETARVMREALEWSKVHVEYVADLDAHSDKPTGEATVALRLMEVALALPPTAAEAQAKANAEKAAKWDEARQIALALDEKLSDALKTKVGFADKDFEIAVTLLGALIEAAFGQKVPENGLVCSAVLTDGSEIFVEARRRTGEPYVKQAEAWRARIAELEATARENAEKAALIESLESERDALAEQVRLMREALEESKVHVAYVADRDTHRHQVSWEASVALRLLEVALALAPTAAEQRAKENAEKAGLLDWLDDTRPSLSFGCSPEYPLGAWGIYWTNAQTKQVEEAEAERLPDALRAAREARDAGE